MRTFVYIITAVILVVAFAVFYITPAFRGDFAVPADVFIGPVKVRLYGFMLAVAILAGFMLATKLAPRFGLEKKDMEGILPWLVIFGFVGARLYFVGFSWAYFRDHVFEIFQIWHGGLAIYGALLGGLVGTIIYSMRRKLALASIIDLLAMALPLGQAIGRWGNFFNQEAFGAPTALPWGMYVAPMSRPLEHLGEQYFHPAFLYESLWDLGIFLILLYLLRGQPRAGLITASYLVLYAIGRYFIEEWRLDSFMLGTMKVDRLVSLLVVAAGALIFYWRYRRNVLENN